jgi:hypothetical protein
VAALLTRDPVQRNKFLQERRSARLQGRISVVRLFFSPVGIKLGEDGSRGFPMFLEIPGGTSPFFCGLDDSARLKGIPDDKMTDLFSL